MRTRIRILFLSILVSISVKLSAQELASIELSPPDKTRGLPFMQALAVKASATEWSSQELSAQDLSDLLWAANGLNRPEDNKTTASSALNAHDVDIFVITKDGVFVYDFKNHILSAIRAGDFRHEIITRRNDESSTTPEAAIQILLVSDADRFRMGSPDMRYEWGALDAGIMSQNISLFCAATGLKTRPRVSMDKDKIKQLLTLKETQHVFLNHPVGYAK